MQVGAVQKGIREAVSMLRPYHEGRHGDWDNYSGLKGNSIIGKVGGKKMNEYMQANKQ